LSSCCQQICIAFKAHINTNKQALNVDFQAMMLALKVTKDNVNAKNSIVSRGQGQISVVQGDNVAITRPQL